MQSLFGAAFGAPPTVDILLTAPEGKPFREISTSASSSLQRVYIFTNGDEIEGVVKIGVSGGRRLDHVGVKLELKGIVEIAGDKGGQTHEFVSTVKELAPPGVIAGLQSFNFRISRADLPHESYEGASGTCRYFLRATVGRTATTAYATKELDIAVQNPKADALEAPSTADTSVKLEVGIEDCLHIEFEYDRTRLCLDDDVTGTVHFLLVRIRIKTMELALVRRETVGPAAGGAGSPPESETLTRFELMDGCPVRGEMVPIRMPLAGLDLTPNFAVGISGMHQQLGGPASATDAFFSVRYFLNLVLLDEEDRRYFKQQELTLYRREFDTGVAVAWGAAPTASATGRAAGGAGIALPSSP